MWLFGLKLATAGLWPFLWHWGLGIGIIIVCLVAAILSESIPVIGPWLNKEREWLLITAAGAGLLLAGQFIGALDATNRCTAKTVVIENTVHGAVQKSQAPKSLSAPDPWDNPNN